MRDQHWWATTSDEDYFLFFPETSSCFFFFFVCSHRNSSSLDVRCRRLEILHRVVDLLPHWCVSRPSFCSQVPVILTVLRKVFHCHGWCTTVACRGFFKAEFCEHVMPKSCVSSQPPCCHLIVESWQKLSTLLSLDSGELAEPVHPVVIGYWRVSRNCPPCCHLIVESWQKLSLLWKSGCCCSLRLLCFSDTIVFASSCFQFHTWTGHSPSTSPLWRLLWHDLYL